MKKIFTVIALLALAFSANATDYTKLDTSADNVFYIEAKVQTGAEGVLNVYMKSTETVGCVDFEFFMPEGFTLINTEDNKAKVAPGVVGSYNIFPNQPNGAIRNAIKEMNWKASDKVALVATIPVQVTAPMGTYHINAITYNMVNMDAKTIFEAFNVYTEVTVQRAASIEPQSPDYAFEIIPTTLIKGNNDLPVLIKNKYDLADFTLTVTYPEGITPKTGRGAAPTVVNDNLYSKIYGGIAALTIGQSVNGQTVTYTVNNTDLDTYLANETPYVAFKLPVVVSDENALYNIKATVGDLKVYNTAVDADLTSPITVEGGEFMTSLFVGTPTETDPIVYGHYTTEAQATLKAASTNFASIDMSAATVDAAETAVAADLTGKLIYGPTATSYNRAVSGYGTICLPFALTSDSNAKYYTLNEVSGNSLTFKEVESVPANTPALVKGTIAASATGYKYASAPVDGATAGGLTMKGTYATYTLAKDAGYYIASDNKFYGDGATVAPFRGYLAGTVSSSKLSVFIDTPTGLVDITKQLSNDDIYNLQGIKLNKTQRGINIIGGKKILVK